MAEGRRQAGWSAVGGERRLCRPWEDIAGEGVLVGWGGPLHSWLPCFNADGSMSIETSPLKSKANLLNFSLGLGWELEVKPGRWLHLPQAPGQKLWVGRFRETDPMLSPLSPRWGPGVCVFPSSTGLLPPTSDVLPLA